MNFRATGAVLLALAVMAGAFGAHALKSRFDAYSMGIWEKAVFYHFIHALGLLIVPLMLVKSHSRICWLLVAGIVFFSGSLYVLALSGITVLGAVTPIGGVCMIAAWLLLAYELVRAEK
jgi:uncharacterized membrane protein YgdD (TMEM256/DUF423 family)